MSLEAPPPSRHVSSTPISISDASAMLQTYLTNSESHPHLHPDALVTPTGIAFSSHGGPTGGVLMHNLRRVAAGLRGEFLEPEKTPEPEQGEEDAADGFGAGRYNNGGKKRKSAEDDWEPMEQFERDQGGVEVGEISYRTNFVQEGGEQPQVQTTGDAQANSGSQENGGKKKRRQEAGGKTDKEARKLAKRERDQQRKRENEAMRAKQA
ncbi:hypothetical protein BDU57DRAFT_3856 [Ampelomyces quisqualis]|uniref:Uncharacterized protein n=1 Tax=Ampelomyces quisqualis TaxID=50730 RepID=A0A6A5QWH3_AMPQU|nr:hypothetical protein BDU57DRAFT_3856 [Ampelomyces quisqualis]